MSTLVEKIEAEGGTVLQHGKTLRGAEAQVFRLAARGHMERMAQIEAARKQSLQQFAADLDVLGLQGEIDLANCTDTPDGGIALAFKV